jgi:hypothetical protein
LLQILRRAIEVILAERHQAEVVEQSRDAAMIAQFSAQRQRALVAGVRLRVISLKPCDISSCQAAPQLL